MTTPRGIDLEIVEQKPADQELHDPYRVIVPTAVRINGLPVLVMQDDPIRITATANNVVTATMTLAVGSLRILPEHLEDTSGPLPIWDQMDAEFLAEELLDWPDPEQLTFAGAVRIAAAGHLSGH